MRAGTRRHRITIQKYAPINVAPVDGFGHVDRTNPANWTEFCKRYASVTVLGTRIISPDGVQQITQTMYEVKMPRDTITKELGAEHRILYGTSPLNVTSAFDPDGRKRDVVLHCTQETT